LLHALAWLIFNSYQMKNFPAFFAAFFLFLLKLTAQNAGGISVFEMLTHQDYLEITLESDFKGLIKAKNKDEYQPAVLSFKDASGNPMSLEIQIKPRGKMRRRVCNMPPLKLKFPKEIKGKGEIPYRTLEMVEICQHTKDYEQFVLREYVAYKLFNMLSNNSFRIQLVKIDFVDKGSKRGPMDGFGFLIENNDEMAERLNGKIIEPENIGRKVPTSQEKELFCLFQFMIGNTDWYITTTHNLDIFSKRDSILPIPIPYDFDYSGFVNTPYAVPNDHFPLKYVTERFYMGPCRSEAETKKTIQIFLDKKAQLIQYCKEFPYFSKSSRKHTVNYLESFYDIIESKGALNQHILNNCDQWTH
jgi:hypothetical protein